jgi:NDP-sugar pyrophosphorylase family protein
MNIIIPMAGLGSRFFTEQYKLPKPLIDIRGKPMIQRAIETLDLDGDYFFLLRQTEYTKQMVDVIKSVVPKATIKIINYITEGPACSALLFEREIDTEDELVIANCDQIMSWNSNMFLRNARVYDGAVVTYHSDTEKNSYARLNKRGLVTEIREKEVISNVSLNGIHYWNDSYRFIAAAKEMIAANDRAENGEFYIGPTYNYMIRDNYRVGIYHIPNEQHHPVGVPADLERYLNYHDSRQD